MRDPDALHADRRVASETLVELARARESFKPMASGHEGYAVILEELDELWREIKKKYQDADAMRAEAIQVAAMAIRFVTDVCDGSKAKP